jgi:hypothetical protein
MRRYAVEVTYLQRNGIRVLRVYYPRAVSMRDAREEATRQAGFDKLTEPQIEKVYPVSQLGE